MMRPARGPWGPRSSICDTPSPRSLATSPTRMAAHSIFAPSIPPVIQRSTPPCSPCTGLSLTRFPLPEPPADMIRNLQAHPPRQRRHPNHHIVRPEMDRLQPVLNRVHTGLDRKLPGVYGNQPGMKPYFHAQCCRSQVGQKTTRDGRQHPRMEPSIPDLGRPNPEFTRPTRWSVRPHPEHR